MLATKNPSGGDAPKQSGISVFIVDEHRYWTGCPKGPLAQPDHQQAIQGQRHFVETMLGNISPIQEHRIKKCFEAFQHVEVLNQVSRLPSAGQPLWETVVACFASDTFAERKQKETKVGRQNFPLF